MRRYISLSKFLSTEIDPFLLGAFLSRTIPEKIDDKSYFYTYSEFKSSKFVPINEFNFLDYAKHYEANLNNWSQSENWEIHSKTKSKINIRFYLNNDLNITKHDFMLQLNKKLLTSDWFNDENINEDKKKFLRAFLELRGSVDNNRNFISIDYFSDNLFELKRMIKLIDKNFLPLKYINFNTRELQKQYVESISLRNTQLRVNSLFYANEIGFINKYKALIFSKNPKFKDSVDFVTVDNVMFFEVDVPNVKLSSTRLINVLNFYTDYIFQKNLTRANVNEFRNILGFDKHKNAIRRNASLIKMFKEMAPKKCFSCGIEETFDNRQGEQYFEIHHVIPFKHGVENDDIDNLARLCVQCHQILKKGVGSREVQLEIIKKLLANQNIFDFCSTSLEDTNIDTLAEKILNLLA
ncbi:HNH endonuclease [Mycoplasmopsis mucosicanis]|uniref:HNH endonuclease n=1 Tax=Mycoplasmopsis mucosicanis TaxID=458208 RepID=A0A507SQD6_9BACT|nr:HNH endonuclease signature motif containing protein [Mycoplasmopsis mucosicanis]TQC51538.1 HNH endonuclease [Mycoplasmopsis mucosicanis]